MPRHLSRLPVAVGLALVLTAAGATTVPGASAQTSTRTSETGEPGGAAGVVEAATTPVSAAIDSWKEDRQAAEAALDRAEEQLSPDGPSDSGSPSEDTAQEGTRTDLTLTLRDLHAGLPYLAPRDRAAARGLLARPTDGSSDPNFDGYRTTAKNDCQVAPTPGSKVCVYWVSSTTDKVPATDSDSDGLPDQVELTRDVLNNVYSRIVTQGGYRAPLPDGRGVDNRLDVFLADIGDDNLFGYCAPERPATWQSASGYCVLDNDFSPAQFGNTQTPEDNLRVTAAHEFFHAVQFAYDVLEDEWFMEGTAMWMEDEIYDDVNDNVRYLQGSQLTNPTRALDAAAPSAGGPYVSWIFWRFLSERLPDKGSTGLPLIIRDTWRRAQAYNRRLPATYSMRAADLALKARGTSLARMFARFGEANRRPGTAYSEGREQHYPTVPAVAGFTLASSKRQTAEKVATMAHMTNYTVVFRPGSGLATGDWRLRVPLDMPDTSRGSRAQVSVVGADGSRKVSWVALGRRGVGVATAPFNSTRVTRVELTITNAGQHYRCNQSSYLSCQGVALDNGLKTYFKGTIRKR